MLRNSLSFTLLKTTNIMLFVGCSFLSFAKEGMWLPPTLKDKEADMKELGLEIPVEKLYNEDGTGLNNAIVLFGKGCTGEIISSKGLLLTNHHCAYGTVQSLSSMQKDYFANGFWAMNHQEEIPCPGLAVTFIRKMENVTNLILPEIPDSLKDAARDSIIAGRIRGLEKGYRFTTGYDATIKPFYNGNQYWVIISETFKDVRLVGFPPNGIGFFGGDTDNWMWPRHNGDFSLFRVYAGKDNKPASYAPDNKPYSTQNFFPISISGYQEGDFTMVYGFPAYTAEYISSYQLNQVQNIIDPIRIAVRTKKLEVLKKHMDASREVFLKYTSKASGVANGWKKWQGEVRGLKMNHVVEKKKQYEAEFQEWAVRDESLPFADEVMSNIYANTGAADSAIKADEYIKEAVYGIELIQQGAALDAMLKLLRSKLSESVKKDSMQKLAAKMEGFYKNYDAATDKELFSELMPLYLKNNRSVPGIYPRLLAENGNNYSLWANNVFDISIIPNQNKLNSFANSATTADTIKLMSDPAWQLWSSMEDFRAQNYKRLLTDYSTNLAYYNRLYMKARMKKDHERSLYPDANQTLRLTYGKVLGIDPEGPAVYSYQTNIDEIIAKGNNPGEEFRVPNKLLELQASKNYGRWAVNGTVPVAFVASNHTSGGNSGSPVLNAKGQLIGINFDRVWDGTMSDYYFDEQYCRNISVDIRYVLFITEKFGNAGWLLKEMKLVK